MKTETKPKPKLPKIPAAPESRAPALAAVWWPVDRPKPYAKNPRRNDAAVEKVAASIREFGWAQPIVVDGDGVIIIGHTRLKAAKKLGLKTVPVLVRADLSPEQVAALRLADNKTAELAEWDEPLLAAELDALVGAVDMEQFGFDLSAPTGTEGQTDEDAVPEPPPEPVSRRGAVYALGRNRLMCGDSTSAEDFARLMGGERASVFVFDPPYEMPEMYGLIPRNDGGALLCFSDHKHFHEPIAAAMRAGWTPRFEFVWDCVQSWYTPNRPLARHKTCTVYGDREDWDFDAAVINDGKHREAQTVYNTRGKCDYVPLDGAVHLRTVEAFANTAQNDENGYGKPVAWVSAILNGYAPHGCVVADMFCGSGAFVIACEKVGRVCYGMELDPHYCDVIRKRWAEFVHGEGCDWQTLAPEVDA